MSPLHGGPPEPPDDPEDWSDEEWLEWLRSTDDAEADAEPANRVTARWRDWPSATVIGAAMIGLRDAIYGRPKDEIVIVQEASGDPPDDDRPKVYLDPDRPENSRVIVPMAGRRRKRRRG